MFEQYFERFTKRVKTVLELARQNAIRYGHAQIETEDVLLGLLDEGQGMGVAVLHFLKVDPEHIRFELEKSIRVGIPLLSAGEIPLSPGVKRVLALSYRQAQYFGHSYVGTEHLLIGLVAEEEGYASKILTRFGLTVDNIRKAIENLLWGEPENISKGKQQSTQHISQPQTKSRTPTIDSYGRDLTQLAEEKKLDPVIGREKEIERVTQILCRRKKNNPVLLGEAGVGKTAIVEGFAQRIASGNIPEILRNKRIIMIDLASLVAGTKYRGEFEQRVKLLLDEIKQSKNIIIFIDELHTLVGAGGAEGAIDASNILKPALSRGEIQCIGATTFDEYRKYIEKDAALERRFQPVVVNPPSVQETIEILRGLRPKYEEHHKLKITDEALVLAAKLADRYITGRYLPDKAIDLVDEAASKQRLLLSNVPAELEELEKRAAQLASLQEQATIQQDFEKAARIRDRLREIRSRINEVKLSWEKSQPDSQRTVTGREIAEIVSRWTGIPLSQLCKEEREKLLEMEEHLHKVVVGQDEAISAVSRAIRRSRAGIKDQKRPIGSFLFLGPTGVGKTLLARALAEFLFGDDQALIQIDMSEYMEKFAISRLIGAPPGYVGYEEGGQLTEKVRRRPYSVVLLDEIEKAHPDVFNLLLQVLEEGRLTDSFGRSVSFQNGILILTSNIGTQHLKNRSTIGFQDNKEEMPYNVVKERILDEVKKTFRPEFLNRLDEIIVFHPLEQEHLLKIVDLEVEKVAERLKEQGFTISLTPEAREFLKNMGTDPQFGARPLRRAISRYLEDPLSEEILKENFPQNSHILVKCDKNRLIFTVTEGKEHVTTTFDKSPVSPD
ncbi:MAG TPA: ATP-dependent Clp protease ATP-binding subunit [bacterium]|nr:ATP-dependent Clp protease ATP-binding subunit [bacterium]HOL34586.1 ATP-dependent Clp protease ATP-binding subunit [bacterium]HPP07629.1 ATP-dependent Clp protease ATP-binding subunit [bacterium]